MTLQQQCDAFNRDFPVGTDVEVDDGMALLPGVVSGPAYALIGLLPFAAINICGHTSNWSIHRIRKIGGPNAVGS